MKTIVDVAVADGHFKTLAKAFTAAGIIAPLKGTGPSTVFAPTDDALAKTPKADNGLIPATDTVSMRQ